MHGGDEYLSDASMHFFFYVSILSHTSTLRPYHCVDFRGGARNFYIFNKSTQNRNKYISKLFSYNKRIIPVSAGYKLESSKSDFLELKKKTIVGFSQEWLEPEGRGKELNHWLNRRETGGTERDDRVLYKTWFDIPPEILESILLRLTLKENIRASAACKWWQTVGSSLRFTDQCPLVMNFPEFGSMYELYDPLRRKIYSRHFPELSGSRVCYSKDGWLLLYKDAARPFFFFNPFTREIIELPRLQAVYQPIAFSSAPTSSGCTVLLLNSSIYSTFPITTWHFGETEWTTLTYQEQFLSFVGHTWDKVVFCRGLFYCVNRNHGVGIFCPKDKSWRNISPCFPFRPHLVKNWYIGSISVAEFNGQIYVVHSKPCEHPVLYKLDEGNKVWEETDTLGGARLFASPLTSHTGTDLSGMERNRVYFTKFRFYGKQNISYSFDDQRFYPCKKFQYGKECNPQQSIWIEPPKDLSVFARTC